MTSRFTFLPSMADALLYQHEILATAKIDAAIPGDRGDLPLDPVYEQVLEGLHLVAKHAALPLLDHFLGWRKEALVKATRAGGENIVLRKRLAVERIFLETAAQLVSDGSSPLSERQADALEKLSFDWILNADKYVEMRYSELYKAREKVTGLGAVIIGHLADTRLAIIGTRYLKEVELRLSVDSNASRQEITQLTEGMRHVRLPTDTTPQLMTATDFLSKIHPLKHTAVQRKSSVHHAMCEMLTAILIHLVRENRPRAKALQLDGKAMAAWYKTVAQLHADISGWTARHSKHIQVAYPLMTLLTCLEEDSIFRRSIDTLTETLTRQLRDKNLRTLALSCLCQCFHGYLVRLRPAARAAEVNAFLSRHTKTILQNLRKNNLQSPDQHDVIRQICIKISERAPEFGIGSLVAELLQDPSNWDTLLIGLRSLIAILLSAPARLLTSQKDVEIEDHQDDVSPELLDMIRNDQLPLAAYNVAHLTPKIQVLLARVIQSCHQVYGLQPMYRSARTPGETPQARPAGLNVFTTALRCVPYIMPEHWAGSRLMDDLPGYTVHADATVRAVAAEVLRRILRGLPGRRNEVIVGMAAFAAKISDEYAESIAQALILVDGLMHEWIAILDEKQQGVMKEPHVPGARRLDLQRLEGVAVSFLCTNDAEVRRLALETLKTVRTLHRSLLASGNKERTGQAVEEDVNYLMNIVENLGSDAARQYYWDFGRWSDLWRVWRPPGDDRLPGDGIDLQDLMRRTATAEDGWRWARVLSELMKSAGKLCPNSARAAYTEIVARVNAHTLKDPTGRASYLPPDNVELWRSELVRNACMVALACPYSTAATKPPPMLTTRELIRLLTNAIRNGSEVYQQIAVSALGYSSSDCYDILIDELQPLMDEYHSERSRTPGSRSRSKGNDIRIQTAHIFRLMAGNMQPGTLRTNRNVRHKFLEFVTEALRFVGNSLSEIWPDVMMVRYCLCFVARSLASELAESQPVVFTPQLRRSLFDALSLCCEEGAQGRNRQEMMRAVGAARARHRSDVEQGRQAEADVVETTEYLEHASHLAMASLLRGPAFDTEAKRHQGRAFGWIERMLTARTLANPPPGILQWGPSKDAVARMALRNLLSKNHDVVDVSLDQCYSPHAALSRAYFQVVVEVYASHDLQIKPHLLLSLVLYKMVDPHSEVRDDALNMLGVLSMRVWKEGLIAPRIEAPTESALPGPSSAPHAHVAVVVGNLQDTYQQFQYQVSAKLAREHPELSEGLCVEMMTRQLADSGGHTLQHQVLTALAPWMENLSFRPRWEGNWSEQLLKSMYYVTLQHGGAFPHEIERLWCTVAANKRNVIPILEFLISRGLQEMNAQDMDPLLRFFDVGKRISLYLARISPQQTIDHLAYEITQLIEADDEPMSATAQPALSVYEFHHARPVPSRHSSHSSQDGRSFHERQRSQSQPAATGTSGLAGLNLMPQSLLPEIMPDIPQMLASATGRALHALPPPLNRNLRRVSDMLRSASSARADVSESFSSALTEAVPRPSVDYSALSSRNTSVAVPPSPLGRGSMMRAEVAVCLLAEVAYEHDEDFRGHLPLLFHSMLLLMDSTDSLVFRHAQQVITHLLYSLSVRHLELHRAAGAMLAEYQKVTSLLTYLQAMRGRRLWHYEDVRLTHINLQSALALSALTNAILESIFFERDLKERWAAEALKWMVDSNSRHLACRSHQIYRALKPAASNEACSAMLSCLFKCMSAPTQLALEVAVDIILTLQVVVESMDETKLLLYPQLLLACFAMLPTSYMHIYALIIDLLQKVLDRLDLNDATVQHVLLASTPLLPDSAMPQLFSTTKGRMSHQGGHVLGDGEEGWPLGMQLFGREQLMCVQQFLVKGLFKSESELCTVEAMACLADQIANLRHPLNSHLITATSLVFELQGAQTFHAGLGAILGEVQAQLALSLISQLPWLCRHFRFSVHAGLAAISVLAHGRACRAAGYTALADALLGLRRTRTESLADILKELCREYAHTFFPRFAKVALQRLMEVLQKGDEMYHGMVLDILKAMFEVPDLDLNSAAHYKSEADKGLLAPIASLLEGQYSQQALQVLNAIIEYQDKHPESEPAGEEMLQWPKAIVSNPGGDTKMSLEALGRLVESWGYSRKKAKDKLMPFIADVQFQPAP